MLAWKVGTTFMEGYLLKIICISNAEYIIKSDEERMYQFVLIKKGNAILKVNGKNIAVTSPSVLCLSDRDEICWMTDKSEYEMDIICFHPCVVNHLFNCDNVVNGDSSIDWNESVNQDRFLLLPFFDRKVPYGGCVNVELNTFHRIGQLFDKLKEQLSLETDYFWPCRCRSYLIEILIIMQMRFMDNSTPKELLELNESQQEMDEILNYIHSNYSNKITIDLLTKQFSINRNSLNERFSELTGYTPISYLIIHRLKIAESLLIDTSIPVHEICERVGFGELSNFMKSFKKKYGKTPAYYRTLYTTMEVK